MSDRSAASLAGSSTPTVQVDTLDGERLERAVIAAYVSGLSSVRFQASGVPGGTMDQRVEATLDRLPGARKGRLDGDQLEVAFETEAVEDPFAAAAKLHEQVQSMLKLAKDAIAQRMDDSSRTELEKAERRCDRILFHLLREDNRGAHWSPTERQTALDAAERLERIADYAYEIADRARDLTPQERVGLISDRLNHAIGDVQTLVERAHEALQAPDLSLGQDVVEDVQAWSAKLEEEAVSLAGTPREPEQLPAHRLYRGYFSLLEDTQRVGLYAKSIAEAGIDRATADLPSNENPTLTLSDSEV